MPPLLSSTRCKAFGKFALRTAEMETLNVVACQPEGVKYALITDSKVSKILPLMFVGRGVVYLCLHLLKGILVKSSLQRHKVGDLRL
jgi:hypothetical protein